MIRQPAVAGQFYSSNAATLKKEVGGFMVEDSKREKAIGIIAPHAGYIYSGAVAGAVYSTVEIPDTVVILGPNHHGFGARAALYPSGEWLTPLGSSQINDRLSALIRKSAGLVEEDRAAHHYEHSLEVQLPFVQYINREATIVPICTGFGSFGECRELGVGMAKAIAEFGQNVLMIASSDMTHYESASSAKKKDYLALQQILDLDPEGLLDVCGKESISMCGVIPATVMIVAALELGATRADIVSYSTSGDVTGDNEQVVAYAGVTVK